jgi:hypothetical protein
MNCREFSDYAAELARARMLEAAAREGALAHAETCAACAARLRGEQSLTAALRATAESMNGTAAPPRVESALLAAFRESRDGGRAPASASHAKSPAAARVSAARFAGWRRRALAASAVAASLLIAFTAARRAEFADAPAPAQEVASKSPSTAMPETDAAINLTSKVQTSPAASIDSTRIESDHLKSARRATAVAQTDAQTDARSGRGRATQQPLASFEVDGGRAVFADQSEAGAGATGAAPAPADTESLTDFVPVAAGGGSAPLDGGQLVRVQVPRAALASLGLPVDADRADGTVKADLLLAHDGTARAIRLVR